MTGGSAWQNRPLTWWEGVVVTGGSAWQNFEKVKVLVVGVGGEQAVLSMYWVSSCLCADAGQHGPVARWLPSTTRYMNRSVCNSFNIQNCHSNRKRAGSVRGLAQPSSPTRPSAVWSLLAFQMNIGLPHIKITGTTSSVRKSPLISLTASMNARNCQIVTQAYLNSDTYLK